MEAIKEQSATPANTSRTKLRYPLRSASKPKDDKLSTAEVPTSSAPKRGRPASNVSKSVNVLDLSGKDKAPKPPRRLSIPAKSTISPASTTTPIAEGRVKRPINGQGKSDTPVSDVSKSTNRRKFCILSSASYWLSQIKLSEYAAKHSVSLGFFKLALEAGCEPLHRMRDELKSYARRHNLAELAESVKELLASYGISEDLEELQASVTCSQVLDDGTKSSSDEDVHSSSSITGAGKLKPKSLNCESAQASPVTELAKKETTQKRTDAARNKGTNKNSANLRSATGNNLQKRSERISAYRSSKQKDKTNSERKKSASEKDSVNPLPAEETQENKENLNAQQVEEISLTEGTS